MASALISNSQHISFDSVLAMDDAGLVAVFESLVATGLKDFLGCPTIYYEAALTEFFENSSVRDGMVVNTIRGMTVEISENVLAGAFQLPMDGLTDLSEVPKDLVFDARSIVSESGEQVSTSCKKREMNIEFRLLSDILAKTIFVKAGSFDAFTHERFLLMTAISGAKINWSRLLFDILKDMATPGSRQAKGFSIQICVLLKNVLGLELGDSNFVRTYWDLELGDSKAFPSPIILTEKTVHSRATLRPKRKSKKRRLRLPKSSDDENVETPVTGETFVEQAIENGEGGSSRPQPPPDDQSRPMALVVEQVIRAEVEEISIERIEVEVGLVMRDVDQMTEVVIQREGDLTVVNQEWIQVYHQREDINGCSLENKTFRLVYFSSLYKSFVR
ncbi:hypothetical protein F511_39003 [Dorcoceras hygrometricum]|uniref:Dystroglycan-like n=1 Tax=Dorcoceras hygrometricum TaxID=472368 RepID=A0A2Z7D7I0_9LAMI|nr:hypothetical protein F511_39003 [Dorcoceras hygrometricum]